MMWSCEDINKLLTELRDGKDGEKVLPGDLVQKGVILMMQELKGYADRRVAEAVEKRLGPSA